MPDKSTMDFKFVVGRRALLAGLCAGIGSEIIPNISKATCPYGNLIPNPSGWRVFRAANPPLNNNSSTISSYQFWPATDVADTEPLSIASTWSGGGATNNWPINSWYYVWSNRSVPLNQNIIGPNPTQSPAVIYNGNQCRVNYTTIQKANAATQCLIRYWLGRSDYKDPWLAIPGNSADDFVYYSQFPGGYFDTTFTMSDGTVYAVMTDRPWLPSAPVTTSNPNGLFKRALMMPGGPAYQNAPGVVLDFEVQDGRATGVGGSAGDPQSTLRFLQSIYSDLHATADSNSQPQTPGQLVLWTNPLNSTGAIKNGLDASNLPIILQSCVDLLSIQLFGRNREGNIAASYMNQIGLLKGGSIGGVCSDNVPYNKLYLTFDIAGTTISDAQFAHNLLSQASTSKSAPPAVWFWEDNAVVCGSTSNAQIAGVLQGTTSPPTSLTYPTAYSGSITCP